MNWFTSLLAATVMLLTSDCHAQGKLDDMLAEGWNAVRTEAAGSHRAACCFDWSMGKPVPKVCKLDQSALNLSVIDTDQTLDEVQIYAYQESGVTRKLLALSPQCPVEAGSPIKDLGKLPEDTGLAWLLVHVSEADHLAERALAAIAMLHGGVTALIQVAENRSLPLPLREHALFWMAQSDSDEAFDYVALVINGETGGSQATSRD